MNRKDYLAMKRKHLDYNMQQYNIDRYKVIESEKYLKYDKPFKDTKQTLKMLKDKGYKVILLTSRRKRLRLNMQLSKFNIAKYINKIMLVNKKKMYHLPSTGREMIGDTEADIEFAKRHGLLSIAITRGMRSREFLMNYEPDIIINKLGDLK
jgi:phosphoglycolate phosphatase